jgi:hypothetical protein
MNKSGSIKLNPAQDLRRFTGLNDQGLTLLKKGAAKFLAH